MKVSGDAALARPRVLRRYQAVILLTVVGLILLLILAQAAANAYTNYLWYSSIHLTQIWRSMVYTKVGLGGVFAGSFFLACFVSLVVVDTVAARSDYFAPDLDLVRRYHQSLGRYRISLRTIVSLVLALAVGVGASNQWQHWLLFENARQFGIADPQFHRDVGFYVFRLPFLSFLVDWLLVALLVLFIVTAVAYYLNGGLRPAGPPPRADSRAVAHLSLILAAMALVRAAGYEFVDRYALDLAHDGVVAGAGYTDVHVRLPAIEILALVSLIGFVLLVYNLYRRTLILPLVAFGLWAFVALVLGLIFPALVQWLEVTPAQSHVELPYIARNIKATREAFGLNSIKPTTFAAHADLQAGDVSADKATFNALPLWNPGTAAQIYAALQTERGYYQLKGLSLDRYELGPAGDQHESPVVIGTRELNQSDLPRRTWVIDHLEYTHGYGAIISPANAVQSGTGQPVFDLSGVPVHSSGGAPVLKQPDIYFGDSASTYVIANTKQPELDHPTKRGPKMSHYAGSGGVQLSGFWQRAAYAMRFHDFNLLVSGLITSKSRIIYNQQVTERVQKAAPFLRVDSNPYPVVANGQVYWIVDCYTTSDYFPYSQNASTNLLPASSGLQGQYNYVRNSVKAVVNAYSGQINFYAVTDRDPVLSAWEHAYPGMIKPLADMAQLSPTLLNHLRYPQDLLTVISSMYGRYRFTAKQAQNFYSGENAWQVAEASPGKPYRPSYELLRLPGSSGLSFVAIEPMVPQSSSGNSQLLTAFLTAASGRRRYGSITAYELPRVTSNALGPALVASKIQRVSSIAQKITLLNQEHSKVELGPTLLVPVDDSLIWVQALFVSSTDRQYPALEYVVADFGGSEVGFSTTLDGALSSIFGNEVVGIGTSSETVEKQIEQDLAYAYQEYQKAIADGKDFQLGQLEKDLTAMGVYLQDAHNLVASEHSATGSKSSSPGGGSPTTTTTVPSSSTSTTPTTSTGGTKDSTDDPSDAG